MHLQSLALSILLIAAQAIELQSATPEETTLANSEPSYVALRQLDLVESFDVDGLTLRRDIGLLQLTGKVAFGGEVLGHHTLGVFTGTGRLVLEPNLEWEQRNLAMHIGELSVSEEFTSAVILFTDETYAEITAAGTAGSLDATASNELERIRSRNRRRRDEPRSRLEAILTREDMDNVEAVILSDLMNANRGGAFMAYIQGRQYGDLRYFVRPRGALSQVLSAEEVALINYDPEAAAEGIWYLAHREAEYAEGLADSGEVKSDVDVLHYEIETTIRGNQHIEAQTKVRFRAIGGGERVIAFGLLPELRASSVNYQGEAIPFIQEDRRADGSFYAILPEPITEGEDYELEVVYAGQDVIRNEGGGNFAVGARTSWYPSLGSFKDRATFDLTFHYPKKFELASVGHLQGKPEKGKDFITARWTSDVPLTVAGFNYGAFNKMSVHDETTSYEIEGYATSTVPGFLRDLSGMMPGAPGVRTAAPSRGVMSPKRMMERVVQEAQASVQVFTQYFGALPYGRIAITQQPQFAFGQSWPTLVYLPISAFLDSTQRFALLGAGAFNFANFIDEVTAHEVAHQWWGHIVGWESYHDQWLSEGLAEFSAGLFLQASRSDPTDYRKSLERSRDQMLDKDEYGNNLNMAGPLWMGSRLSTPRNPRASQLNYSKGGYVIHMLRSIMHDRRLGDGPFIEMMKDFVKTHENRNATTESFKAVVDRHVALSPELSAVSGGKMDWFFDQWVYGTEIPSYEFAYRLTPQDGGKTLIEVRITQNDVSDDFVMPVMLYAEADGRELQLGSLDVKGSGQPREVSVTVPIKLDGLQLNANHDVLAR